jgi:hypothetical protein
MTLKSKMLVRGNVLLEKFDERGKLVSRQEVHNLITDVGDIYCAAKMFSSPTAAAGMKLGTATTAAAKNGAGAFVAAADYISGSAQAFDGTYPKVGASNNIVQFRVTWAAGTATNATINRVGIVDNTTDAGEANAAHTFATAVFSTENKAANHTLVATWTWAFLGS